MEIIHTTLMKNKNLCPIVPELSTIYLKSPFSRFTVATIDNFQQLHRGPNGTVYLAVPGIIPDYTTPWNIDRDTLSQKCKSEWLAMDESSRNQETEKPSDIRPTKDVLETRVWIRENLEIGGIQPLGNALTKDAVYNSCPYKDNIKKSIFGKIISNVFPNLQDHQGGGRNNTPGVYTNLIKRR